VHVWNQGQAGFELSSGTLEALVDAKQKVDFAVLLLTADDLTHTRGPQQSSPRDNVIFELGLFMGALGRERTFVVCDQSTVLKVPSDLHGITTPTFDASSDSDPSSVMAPACFEIIKGLRRLGRRDGEDDRPRVTLIGSTTDAIDASPAHTVALRRFYKPFFSDLERTPFGVNTCGPEPIRSVLFDMFRTKLDRCSRKQIRDIESRVRWYWRRGGNVGLNYEPPIFENREVASQDQRRRQEVRDAAVVVALAGRSCSVSSCSR
jgi:hypothetical protein